ncbi:terpenoid synthase [Sanghuangporus baumii]|uniref:Terpene synthase n=1 Tax=Sanghuangporus baumii TaxID=108892 RepID=A0A9Q5HZ99_SANBA|nr:terpenoid synthase [Sanghuangporus baumii]
MQQATELTLNIPDLFSSTPFPWAGCNPLYTPAKRESTEWILDYGLFSDYRRTRFRATYTELLGAYAYPYADAKSLRIASDWVTLLAACDQFTDEQDKDGAKATRDAFIRALHGDPEVVPSPITSPTKDFMASISHISTELHARFVSHLIQYIDGISKEATLRTDGEFPSFEEYIKIRRDNGGLFPCCDIVEIILGITLPRKVIEDKNFQKILDAAVDMMCLSNDIYSYALEYASGLDSCNAVTILMHNEGLLHQEAMDRTAQLYKNCADIIVACKLAMRSFGPEVDEMVRAYLYGVQQAICGNNSWSMDTPRYFGDNREEVKRTGIVKITQRKSSA